MEKIERSRKALSSSPGARWRHREKRLRVCQTLHDQSSRRCHMTPGEASSRGLYGWRVIIIDLRSRVFEGRLVSGVGKNASQSAASSVSLRKLSLT
eukprot:397447-Rhodomonas_salina.3